MAASSLIQTQIPSVPTPAVEQNIIKIYGSYLTIDLGTQQNPHNYFRVLYIRFSTNPYTIHFLESNDNSTWIFLGSVSVSISLPTLDRTPLIFNYPTSTKRYLRMVLTETFIGYGTDMSMADFGISYNNQINLITSFEQISASSDFNISISSLFSSLRVYIQYRDTYNVSSGLDTKSYYIGNISTIAYNTKIIVYPIQIPFVFLAPTPLVKDVHHILGSTIIASTLNTRTMNASTVSGNVIQLNTLQCNTALCNTVQTDTLLNSTIVANKLYGGILIEDIFPIYNLYATTKGEYITFDFGTSNHYHDNISMTVLFYSAPYHVSLFGSYDNTNWIFLGHSQHATLPVVGLNNTLTFNYAKMNTRYLRMCIRTIYVYARLGTGKFSQNNPLYQTYSGAIRFNNVNILNSNGINIFTDINNLSYSAELYKGTVWNVSDFELVTNKYQTIDYIAPQQYIGTTTTTNLYISPGKTLKYTELGISNVIGVVISGSTIQTSTLYYNTLACSTILTTNLQVNSLTGSTIQTNTLGLVALTASTLQTNVLQVNRLIGSTIQTGVLQTSTIIGNTIQPDAFIASTIFGSTMRSDNVQVSTIYVSGVASSITTNRTINTNLLSFNTLLGSTIQANTYSGSTITASTMQMNRFNIETLPTSGNTNTFNTLSVVTLSGSTFITSTVQGAIMNIKSTLVGSTIQTNTLNGNTIITSTIQTDTLQVSTLSGNQLVGNIIESIQFNTSSVTGSTLQTNVLQVSTVIGSTIQCNQLNLSTILGSTIQMTQLNTSSIVGSTIQNNVLVVSTIFGSTVQVNILAISTIVGSTIRANTYLTSIVTGSTVQTNTILANTLYGSSIVGNTLQTSYMTVSTLTGSTIIGNNFQANKILVTNENKALSTSATNATQLQYITNLTSRVCGTGQQNEWTSTQTFSNANIYFNGIITSNSPYYTLGLNASNQLVQNIVSGANISGIATPNYIPYASGSSILSDSIIYRVNATDLAIGQITSAFPTFNTFNYFDSQKTYGDYFTFDLGTAGNYHNRFYIESGSWTTTYQLHFFGSDNNTSWISLGIATASNSDGTGNYYYTLSNKRYLRAIIITVINQSNFENFNLVAFMNLSISNNDGANLFTNMSQISLSPIITPGNWWSVGAIKLYYVQYTRYGHGSIGTYTGTTFTTLLVPKTGSVTVTVAGLTQTTNLTATTGTFSKIFMGDKRTGLNGTLIPGNHGCNFYMGTMNNNGTGNLTDVLYLNSWYDTTAGNINVVMFNKSTIGMRIFQGAVGATSTFTTYSDALLTDTNSGTITIGKGSNTNGITFGPNASWASYLKIGAGTNREGTDVAQVTTTNGDLHLTCATNTRGLWLNHYVRDSASTYIKSYTPWTHNGNVTIPNHTLEASGSINSSDWLKIDGAYGIYWNDYGRGIVSPEQAGNPYGHASTWNTGRSSISGWGLGRKACWASDGTKFGILDSDYGWTIECDGGPKKKCLVGGSCEMSQDTNLFVCYFNGANGTIGMRYVNDAGQTNMSSDERIKKNIKPIDQNQSIMFINGIIPSLFCLKEAKPYTKKDANGKEEIVTPSVSSFEQCGFIAQNVLESAKKAGLPESTVANTCEYEKELLLPEEDRKTLLGISVMPIISHSVAALKSLIEQLEEQQLQINELQRQILLSEADMNDLQQTAQQQNDLLRQLFSVQ